MSDEVSPFGSLVLLTVLLLAGAFAFARRANELFVLSARDGKVLILRGRLPRTLERELSAVLRAAGAKVSASVSSRTSLLVCGEKAGSSSSLAQSR